MIKKVKHDLERLPKNCLISMSNSSDPYNPLEADLKITHGCLREFLNRDLRLLVITKSDLVTRDLDLLLELRDAVTITITALDKDLARKLEPNAPPPSKRLDALSKLSSEGISTGVRVDPIIPFLNDDGLDVLLREIKNSGARHVTASTFKPRWDGWRRMKEIFPEVSLKLEPLYFGAGERVGRGYHLPASLRFRLMKQVADECGKLGLTFATCREGFPELKTSESCDGSHLIK